MKKHYAAIAVMAAALAMTACSSGSGAKETTAAQTTTAAETTAAETEAEEEDFFDGTVSAVDGSKVTVKKEDGTEAVFDIEGAEISGADAVGEGDDVDITYTGQLAPDVTKAKQVDIMFSAAEAAAEEEASQNDPVENGAVEKVDDKTLTLKTEEGTYTFNILIAQKVSLGGIKAGVNAEVTYYGDLDDPDALPVATRIVTEDAADTAEASVYTLTGTVAEAGTDHVVLETADPDNTLFTFLGTAGMFDGVETGDTVTVIYEGTLTNKTITAKGLLQ